MLRSFFKKSYKHLNKIRLSKKALFYNHQVLQKSHPEAKVCPVLKSNAYGHGLRNLAPIFDSMNCPFLIVDSLFEAYTLYKLNVKTPILIIGYTNPSNFTVKKLPFNIAIFDLETAIFLNKHQPKCNIHLFIDTGMSREGILVRDLPKFIKMLKKLKNLNIVGLCSHFADADNSENYKFTDSQVGEYKKAVEILNINGIYPIWKHISASAGAAKLVSDDFNMIRAGLSHYGINPLEKKDKYRNKIILQPVFEFVSTLVQIKKIPKGKFVGYNCTFSTNRDTVLGLLPAGYYEGIDRRLSNKGVVKIRNQYFPIVGRVSMNMTIIDITKLKRPKVGENVVVYSSKNEDKNLVSNTASLVGTIPYEILVNTAESVYREIT